LRDNSNTRQQTLTRPSPTQRNLSESTRQRTATGSIERSSSPTTQQQRSALPGRDDVSRMKTQGNVSQRKPATSSYNGRTSGQVQRSQGTVQRSSAAPAQVQRAPSQIQRAPAQVQRAPAQVQRAP